MVANRPTKRLARQCLWLVLGAGVVLTAMGCGSGERTVHHVSGTVTFDGRPVPAGFVLFEPDVSAGNDGTQGFAEIQDGRFDTARRGRGVTGGAYIARLQGNAAAEGSDTMRAWQYEQTIDLPAADSRHDLAVPASAATGIEPMPEPP